ncbi:uncharacterized protein EAF01_011301 [Botrytis porri]|uniref:uncharacterized protein n=1 Tax=Botrytis porri TaxID=87229 RepID=UPI0019027A20|nr:uncharacterized protein EAF01_011301 [Botrytis porri]KAF7886623.1 hypothetical protein EAF01_011301 [Botrytis porri]
MKSRVLFHDNVNLSLKHGRVLILSQKAGESLSCMEAIMDAQLPLSDDIVAVSIIEWTSNLKKQSRRMAI